MAHSGIVHYLILWVLSSQFLLRCPWPDTHYLRSVCRGVHLCGHSCGRASRCCPWLGLFCTVLRCLYAVYVCHSSFSCSQCLTRRILGLPFDDIYKVLITLSTWLLQTFLKRALVNVLSFPLVECLGEKQIDCRAHAG